MGCLRPLLKRKNNGRDGTFWSNVEDTAKACGTVSITTIPLAHPPTAGNGRKTTTHVQSGKITQVQRPRSNYSIVRGTGWQSRESSPVWDLRRDPPRDWHMPLHQGKPQDSQS
ncbi:hypothetical protein J4Q44_G00231610 [Coregonus suidteri]|uniref:Uncharacterized protein n=1 Tax=Coregonus suidteri TaxID=861788 RepID=A0AAN8LM98_9TELE